jgi:hypothetical protein
MDANRKQRSDLGNDKNLENAERNNVTGIKTSDLPKGDKPVVQKPKKKTRGE